jgi:hypothetical protein
MASLLAKNDLAAEARKARAQLPMRLAKHRLKKV